MPSLKELISSVYEESEVTYLLLEIEELISQYKDSVEDSFTLSEKDVVLIAYGDHVNHSGEAPISTLRKFLDQHFEELISIVHLLPFYPFTSDDGFSVVDYHSVNNDLGDWSDIEELSEDRHLMFDGVINHTSVDSKWFKGYLNGDTDFANHYLEVDDLSTYSEVVRPRTSPLTHQYQEKNGKMNVWTTFSQDQVDLNYQNPRVFLRILEVLLYYLSKGANLIRLDAIGFLWKAPNTTCIHLPQTHAIIKSFRKVIEEVAPSTLLITETNVPHRENISYFGEGDEAHMVYNFALPPLLAYSILSGETNKLTSWAQSLELPSDDVCFFNFLASHDGVGVRPVDGILDEKELGELISAAKANAGEVSYRTGPDGNEAPYEINCNYFSLLKGKEQDEHLGIQRMLLAHAILLAMPGVPAIYFSSLVGAENYLDSVKNGEAKRSINREKFDDEKLTRLLDNENTTYHRISSGLKTLIEARKSTSAFHPYESFEFGQIDGKVFTIKRSAGQAPVTCYFNLSNETVEISIKTNLTDIISGQTIRGELRLSPYGYVWLRIKDNEG